LYSANYQLVFLLQLDFIGPRGKLIFGDALYLVEKGADNLELAALQNKDSPPFYLARKVSVCTPLINPRFALINKNSASSSILYFAPQMVLYYIKK